MSKSIDYNPGDICVLADDNETVRSGIQLWRAQGDLDKDVVEEFYERAHFTEEIWKRDNKTIDFLVFDEEGKDVGAFLDEHNVTHKVLIDNVHERVDDAVIKTFPFRRNGKVSKN